jgi:hypothetical protein
MEALVRNLAQQNEDTYAVHREICRRNKDTLASLSTFADIHQNVLPQAVSVALTNFVGGEKATLLNDTPDLRKAKAGTLFLMMLENEVSPLLAGNEIAIRLRTERAFLHLQQLLATDGQVKTKWQDAFTDGETACEKLGAVHLLWHGIFAFKAHTETARTDLVFNEPIEGALVARTDSGLVLTEWKKSDGTNGIRRFTEAREQARLYSSGILSGIELAGFRYAVVVSQHQLPAAQIPDDAKLDGVTYRHINIAIDPRTPSVQAPINTRSHRRAGNSTRQQ